MNDLFTAPAAPPAPAVVAPFRRQSTMPARFLWPGDVLLVDGKERELTRVEVTGTDVIVYAGAGGRKLGADDVVVALVAPGRGQ